jgi:hypothetical protein
MNPTTKQPKTTPEGVPTRARKTAVATPGETAAQPAESDAAPTKTTAPKTPRLSPSLKAQADRVIAARDGKKARAKADRKRGEPEEETVVFAFRLSPEERELIHQAAGPAKASRFVRALAVAAACHDEAAIKLLLQSVQQATA